MQLEPSSVALRALQAPGSRNHPSLLEELFAYELEPYRPPTPPPKPKAKVDKAEAAARRRARAARYELPRVAGRSTRHTVALGIDKLVEQAAEPIPSGDEHENVEGVQRHTAKDSSTGVASASQRIRLMKGKSKASRGDPTARRSSARGRQAERLEGEENAVSVGASTSNESNAAGSGETVRRNKPQRGVVGEESYSPLGPRERRERDRQMAMELVVENLDRRDDFKRFNVGWVLPEGTKRGGRRDRQMDQMSAVVPKKRKCVCCVAVISSSILLTGLADFTASKFKETSAFTPSLTADVERHDPADPSRPEPEVSVKTGVKVDSTAEVLRQHSRSPSSESSLSELSELSDLPEDEVESEGEAVLQNDVPNGDAKVEEEPKPESSRPINKRIRKRTHDSKSDYLVPPLKKQARLPSALIDKTKKSSKTDVNKLVTPTESDLSSLSHESNKVTESKEVKASEEEKDDAEPDEDEQRDERLASLRGTNGSTAVGKWIDPYPDGTLGKQRFARETEFLLINTPFIQYGRKVCL